MKKLAYVTNTDSNDISIVDIEDKKELGRIPVGGSPRGGMAIDKKGIYGYVSNCAGNTVSVIDVVSNRETGKISVGNAPRGVVISPDDNFLFVSNSGSNDVSVIDLNIREELVRIPVGDNPRALSITPDGKYVNVPCWGADSLSIIEMNYESPEKSRELYRIPLGKDARPYHAFSDIDNVHVYTANTHKHTISVINILDLKVEQEIKVGYGPRAVISDPVDPFLYVSCEASNAVSVVDKNNWEEIKQIKVGPTPRGLKIDKPNEILMVSAFTRTLNPELMADANSLSVIDLRKQEKVGTIKTGLGPCSINIYDPSLINQQTIDSKKKEVLS
ncbi:YncE family protein [Priestia megaterium]|uniref:YncE family protein n=1 Tax=Priestia megaterium TaxID=1404 RepID=UPI001F13FEDC|nr:YncE family protein [Priestia megaterium]UMZ36069.1 YncE family protein [Priestia megaterium]